MEPLRIGLVVPSSNVTFENELPQILRRLGEGRFTFHSSRMTMRSVSAGELAAMNAQQARCADELCDAGVDAVMYGCLVALMAEAPGAHVRAERTVSELVAGRGLESPVVSSAGALVEAIGALDATRVALVMPYMKPLASKVVEYLEASGITVVDWVALEVPDNAEVARIDGSRVLDAAATLDLSTVDALVISACVQMPSLDLIPEAERRFGLPVLSAATASAYALLRRLGLPPLAPGAGRLLAGTSTIEQP